MTVIKTILKDKLEIFFIYFRKNDKIRNISNVYTNIVKFKQSRSNRKAIIPKINELCVFHTNED